MSPRVHGQPPFLRKSRRQDGFAQRSRRWLVGGGLILLLYALVFGDGGFFRLWSLRNESRELAARQNQLRDAQTQLDQRLAALRAPASFELERVARNVYRLQRPDETVLQVVDPDADELP